MKLLTEVILQTYIESLRAKVGVTFNVNHHGRVKTIKVCSPKNLAIILLGFFQPIEDEMEEKKKAKGNVWMDKLIPDEKKQIDMMITITQLVIPIIALLFIGIYFSSGLYFVYLDPKYNF